MREILQRESLELTQNNEVSVYTDQLAQPRDVGVAMKRLSASFSRMEDEFFNILSERIVKNGFTKKRLEDAVNSIIDNFQYKELNVSDVIRFDKKVKLYTYNEVCYMVTKGQAEFSDFEIRVINGTHYRVYKKDIL